MISWRDGKIFKSSGAFFPLLVSFSYTLGNNQPTTLPIEAGTLTT
jgi:hypothetical protein